MRGSELQELRSAAAVQLRRLHDMRAVAETPHVLASFVHLALVLACLTTWRAGAWPLTAICWLALAWLNHAALARMHEAVHGMLSRSRWRNEAWGIAIGTLSLIPMSVYRYVHKRHHAHLGGERDPEFWPYSLPHSARWVRLSYAFAEIALGALVTPALYTWRTFAAWAEHRRALRCRLVLESLAVVVLWTTVIAAAITYDWWPYLVVVHGIPAWITGVIQTLRKFTEHLGRSGTTIPAMTRTVVYRGRCGRLASASQLHVDHHGTHHRWPRIPYRLLPEATALIQLQDPTRPFPNHFAALRDAFRHLGDPRVGPQWESGRASQGGRAHK